MDESGITGDNMNNPKLDKCVVSIIFQSRFCMELLDGLGKSKSQHKVFLKSQRQFYFAFQLSWSTLYSFLLNKDKLLFN